MDREGVTEGEEDDECIVGWREMEKQRHRRRGGKEQSSKVMDCGEDRVTMEWVKKEKARLGEFCLICSIIIQCVSV